MSRKKSSFPVWGIGGIVIEDPSKPWVTSENFKQVLTECTSNLGIHYLDTAERYGDAEKIMGEWLSEKGTHSQLVIGTKVAPPNDSSTLKNTFTSDYILNSATQSLQKLKIDSVDVFWMHGPDRNTDWETMLPGFHQVVQSGLAKKWGISNVTMKDIEEILNTCENRSLIRPNFVQNEFNLLNYSSELEVLGTCKNENLQYLAFSPLAGGILTGKYQFDSFPSVARWSHWKNTRGLPTYWTQENFLAMDKLKEFSRGKQSSIGSVALAWVHLHADINTTLVGPRNLTQTTLIKEAQALKLTSDELSLIQSWF